MTPEEYKREQDAIDDLVKLAVLLFIAAPIIAVLGLTLTFIFINRW